MHHWIIAIRLKTLPAAFSALLVGNMLAIELDQFSWLIALTSMLCALLLQVSVNLANDYYDFKNEIDTENRLGPIRVCQSGLIKPTLVRNAMFGCLMLSVLLGSVLILQGGWPIAVVGIASVLAVFGYSSGPYPLASNALGELAAFTFFGLVAVIGSYYLQAGTISLTACLLGAAIGFFNAGLMLVNNTRDMASDSQAGKITLALKIGEAQAKVLYQTFMYLPFGIIIAGFLLGELSGLPVFLAGVTLVIARRLSQSFRNNAGIALNPILGQTAMLTLAFSVLFSLGLYLNIGQ